MDRDAVSFLEVVSIAEVERDRAALTAAHFTPGEAAAVARRHVRTTAGMLALKRALAALYGEVTGGGSCRERDFVITNSAGGAPRLAASPAGLATERVLISISHSKTWAYGLAVWRRDGDA